MGPIVLRTAAIVMAAADDQCSALTSSGQRPSLRHPAGWAPGPLRAPPFPAWALASSRAHTLCGSARLVPRRLLPGFCAVISGRRGPFLRTARPAPRAQPRAPGKAPHGGARVGPARRARPRFAAPVRRLAPSLRFAGAGPPLPSPPRAPVLCPRPSSGRPGPWAWGPGAPFGRAGGAFPPALCFGAVVVWLRRSGGPSSGPLRGFGPGGSRPCPPARPLGRAFLRGGPGRFVCPVRPLRRGSSGGGCSWAALLGLLSVRPGALLLRLGWGSPPAYSRLPPPPGRS